MRNLLRNVAKDLLQTLCFRGRFVWRLPTGGDSIALTFDDGPHAIHTPATLDMLGRAGARATFFLIGSQVEKHPDLARRIVAEGHAVGGHSYDHSVITLQSPSQLQADLRHCRDVIAQATGSDTVLFRPPRGEVSFRSIRNVCRQGYRLVHWSKTFSDYKQDSTRALLARIERTTVRRGDILLFHDHNRYTVEALSAMIPSWAAAGLRLRALEQSLDRETIEGTANN